MAIIWKKSLISQFDSAVYPEPQRPDREPDENILLENDI